MSCSDHSALVDAILSNAGQTPICRHTQEVLSELQQFCSSVNDALEVYGVKGVDVNLVIEDGAPEDISAFKQSCRAILDKLNKTTSSPDVAMREARISLQSITNDVREELASRFTFCPPGGVEPHCKGEVTDIDFLADGFIVRFAGDELGVVALLVEIERQAVMMNWGGLSPLERGGAELPKVPQLEPLRSYDMDAHKSVLSSIRQGVLPKEFQKRSGAGQPIPIILRVHDWRPRAYADCFDAIGKLKRMHEQQKREREEADRIRLEAERKEQEEAERKKREDRLLSLEEASRARRKEIEEAEVAAHAEEDPKKVEEKDINAVVSALVALRNRYKESDVVGLVTCLTTLQTYIKNLSSNPEEPKFRHINVENSGFKKRVAAFEGAIDVLLACDFHQESAALVYSADVSKVALSDVLRKIDIILEQVKR